LEDADIGIKWPLQGEPLLSKKDVDGVRFAEADYF
jgi:dTDP-4-dehydrorhamnose 3,5-epimerase-like enzyme